MKMSYRDMLRERLRAGSKVLSANLSTTPAQSPFSVKTRLMSNTLDLAILMVKIQKRSEEEELTRVEDMQQLRSVQYTAGIL